MANARKRKVETRGTRKDKRKRGTTESTVKPPGLRRGNEHTHYLRGLCSSSKYGPTDGNDYTSLGGRTGTSEECRLLACPRLCTYCTRVAYEYLYPDHLRGPATARIGPGPRDWPTRVSWDTWNGHDRDRQNVELAPTAVWGIRPKVQHCQLVFFCSAHELGDIRKLLYNPSPIDLLPLL